MKVIIYNPKTSKEENSLEIATPQELLDILQDGNWIKNPSNTSITEAEEWFNSLSKPANVFDEYHLTCILLTPQ